MTTSSVPIRTVGCQEKSNITATTNNGFNRNLNKFLGAPESNTKQRKGISVSEEKEVGDSKNERFVWWHLTSRYGWMISTHEGVLIFGYKNKNKIGGSTYQNGKPFLCVCFFWHTPARDDGHCPLPAKVFLVCGALRGRGHTQGCSDKSSSTLTLPLWGQGDARQLALRPRKLRCQAKRESGNKPEKIKGTCNFVDRVIDLSKKIPHLVTWNINFCKKMN